MKRKNEHPIQQLCRVCFVVLLVAACLYFVIWQVVEPEIDLDQTDASVLEGLTYTASDGSVQAVEPEHRYPFDADGVFEVRGVLPPGSGMKACVSCPGMTRRCWSGAGRFTGTA